jgi:hypothetical protein
VLSQAAVDVVDAGTEQVETMVRAAHLTQADVVTCVNHFLPSAADAPTDRTVPHGSFIPLGGAAAAGMFENSFGDANALLRRSLLDEAPLVRAGGFAPCMATKHSLRECDIRHLWLPSSDDAALARDIKFHTCL